MEVRYPNIRANFAQGNSLSLGDSLVKIVDLSKKKHNNVSVHHS